MSLEKKLEILMSKLTDEEKHWQWVQACMEVLSEIDNDWENGFIQDIFTKMDKNRNFKLSPRQADILERIYAEKTK